MKVTTALPAFLALVVASAGGVALVARADAPPPPRPRVTSGAPRDAAAASAIVPAAPGSAASTSAASHDEPLAPAIAAQTFPAERSKIPVADEWKTATLVEPTRRSILAMPCRVYLLREWIKVHCPFPVAGIRQHTGNPKDVQIWVTPKKIEDGTGFIGPPHGGQVVFPLVAGEAHMFQFFELDSEGYSGMPFPKDSIVVDAFWTSGRPGPELVLR